MVHVLRSESLRKAVRQVGLERKIPMGRVVARSASAVRDEHAASDQDHPLLAVLRRSVHDQLWLPLHLHESGLEPDLHIDATIDRIPVVLHAAIE